eukprot:4472936-Prymnesium_polylepis.1
MVVALHGDLSPVWSGVDERVVLRRERIGNMTRALWKRGAIIMNDSKVGWRLVLPVWSSHVSAVTGRARGLGPRGVGGGETATGVLALGRPKTGCTWVPRMGAE